MREKQVASFDLSKKLHKLGLKQPSLFYWHNKEIETSSEIEEWCENHLNVWDNVIPAYTVGELGDMLPDAIEHNNFLYHFDAQKDTENYHFGYICVKGRGCNFVKNITVSDKSESNCRAKMLIHLIENNLIDLKLIQQAQEPSCQQS